MNDEGDDPSSENRGGDPPTGDPSSGDRTPSPPTDDGRVGPSTDADDGVDRKRLVRVLIVVGIGVPILVEAVSLVGLVSHSLGDTADTPEPTEAVEGVGVGDELLAETGPTETVSTASVTAYEDRWQFVLTVSVANVTGDPYRLSFGTVTTGAGETVETTATTGWIDPGEEGTGTATWALPPGERPSTLTVVVSRDREDEAGTEYEVTLGTISVRQ